jgi:hypothetical protein
MCGQKLDDVLPYGRYIYIYRGSLLETIEEGLTVRPLGGLV